MLKNISGKQDDYLLLLEKMPELEEILDKAKNDNNFGKAILSLTSEEINCLNKILSDPELKEQFDIVFTYDFINFIKEHGHTETLKIISDLSNRFSSCFGNKFEKVITIFDYMEYLLYYDDIMKFSSKDISDESIQNIIELKKDIEENRLAELHKDSKKTRIENQSLTTKNEELLSTKKALLEEIESLKSARETLKAENSELERQIDNKRLVLSSNLDEEMTAEKIKRQAQIDSEIKAEKEKKNDEIITLNDARNKLLLDLQQIESKLNFYGIDSKHKNKLSSEPINDVEVIWEPISENHEIYFQNHATIKQYIDIKKAEYQKMTGKSEDECTYDFLTNCPMLGPLVKQVEYFDSLTYYCTTSIKDCIEYKQWYGNTYEHAIVLVQMLKKVKLPRYIIKEKTESIWKDNLEQYLALLDLKADIAKLKVDNSVAETQLNYVIEMLSPFIPKDANLEIPNKEGQNILSRNK